MSLGLLVLLLLAAVFGVGPVFSLLKVLGV